MQFRPANVPKLGLISLSPRWRYDVIQYPDKFGMIGYVIDHKNKDIKTGKGCLKRFVFNGAGCVGYSIEYKIPKAVKSYQKLLPADCAAKLQEVWHKNWKKTHPDRRKIICENKSFNSELALWNMNKLHTLSDDFLVTAIKHFSRYEYNYAIQYALDWFRSHEKQVILSDFGALIFSGVNDTELAHRFKLSVKQAEAVRLLFFDFSVMPKDRIAVYAYLKQLSLISVIHEHDFSTYKRVFALGEVGVKAEGDYFRLNDEDKKQVDEYLKSTAVTTTLQIHSKITTVKEALAFQPVVANLSNHFIKQEELRLMRAKTHHLTISAKKIENDLGTGEKVSNAEDENAMKYLRELSLKSNYSSGCPALADLDDTP